MLALGIIVAILTYLGIGAVIGRQLFIESLGNSPRMYEPYPYGRPGELESTAAYVTALKLGINSVYAWPIVWLIWTIQAPTPHEKMLIRKQEMKELESEIKRLEREYDLVFNK